MISQKTWMKRNILIQLLCGFLPRPNYNQHWPLFSILILEKGKTFAKKWDKNHPVQLWGNSPTVHKCVKSVQSQSASQPTTNVLASSLTPSLPNPFCATAFVLKIHHPPPGPEPHMKASSKLRRTSCVVFGPSFHWLRGLLLTFDFLQIEWFYCNIKLCCQ